MTKLKPCPKCGGSDIRLVTMSSGKLVHRECHDCGFQTIAVDIGENAQERADKWWNNLVGLAEVLQRAGVTKFKGFSYGFSEGN